MTDEVRNEAIWYLIGGAILCAMLYPWLCPHSVVKGTSNLQLPPKLPPVFGSPEHTALFPKVPRFSELHQPAGEATEV